MAGLIVLIVVWGILGALTGFLAPIVFKGRRPFGLGGDIIAGILVQVGGGLAEWLWLLPLIGGVWSSGWIKIAVATSDPWFGVLIVLWLMRKIRS